MREETADETADEIVNEETVGGAAEDRSRATEETVSYKGVLTFY